MEALGTRAALASTHHPQTNGATERANRTLIQMIRKFVRKRHAEWATFLPLFEFAYNSAVHSVTGVAPFVAELARMPLLPVSMLIPQENIPAPSASHPQVCPRLTGTIAGGPSTNFGSRRASCGQQKSYPCRLGRDVVAAPWR